MRDRGARHYADSEIWLASEREQAIPETPRELVKAPLMEQVLTHMEGLERAAFLKWYEGLPAGLAQAVGK